MSIQLFLFTLNGDITFLIETAELRAALKVPQMSVQEFVTGARLTTVRPCDPLTKGHLNNSPAEITLGLISVA